MKFILHSWYNNNSYLPGAFKSVEPQVMVPSDGYVTDQGIAFFMTPKVVDIQDRVDLARRLDTVLKKKYGQGLSGVTSAVSDCADFRDFEPFFAQIKQINPAIKTIEVAYRSGHSLSADFSVGNMNDNELIRSTIINAIVPSDRDKVEPKEGWKTYTEGLQAVYRRANGEDAVERPGLRKLLSGLFHMRH